MLAHHRLIEIAGHLSGEQAVIGVNGRLVLRGVIRVHAVTQLVRQCG